VQTPFGKGVVRELRNNGRVLVDVRRRNHVFTSEQISPADAGGSRRPVREPNADRDASRTASGPAVEIDLHGLSVDEALERVQRALNDALLGDSSELRLVHGRSGGRIRAALHRWLNQIGTVRFRLDPRNEGVTIVQL
jgi:DNA mismatch repair protein MutS2